MKRIILAGFLFLSQAVIGQNYLEPAQVDTSFASDSFYVLSPVEIRAVRMNEKSPFAVTNLSERTIRKNNSGQGLPYLLSQTPSLITSSDDGTGVGYSSMRIRGSDITRINVTLNGIPVNDAESQGVFFVNMADLASSVNSIQIQRGVGASTNGTGAFGASVNISNNRQSDQAMAAFSSVYGSFSTFKNSFNAATGKLPNGFQFDVRLSKISSDGYIDRAFSDLKSLHLISGWTSKNEKTTIKFNLMSGQEKTGQAWNGIGTSFTDNTKNSYHYRQQIEKAGRTSNSLGKMSDGGFYKDQTDNYQQDHYQLFINNKINPAWSVSLSGFLVKGRGFYSEYKQDEKYKSYGLPNIVLKDTIVKKTNLTRQLWLDNAFYGSVFSTNYNTSTTEFIAGGAITKYDGAHYGFVKWTEQGGPLDHKWYDVDAYKTDGNLFVKIQQQIATGWYGFADLQYRQVVYNMYGFRKSPETNSLNKFSFINPKAGFSYLVKHPYNAMSKLFASFAVANKEPNRKDFEADLNTKPERLYDWEAGYQYASQKITGAINGYFMKYKDQLVLTGAINDVGANIRTNVEDSYRAGVELSTTLLPVTWIQIDAHAAFSSNKIKSFVETQYQYDKDWNPIGTNMQEYKNTDISFSPNTVAGATVRFEPFYKNSGTHHFYTEVATQYVGRQFLDNTSNIFRSILPYSLTDLRFRYQASLPRVQELELTATINNVFNKKYENNGYTYSYFFDGLLTTENYYFPQAGTNFSIGLNLRF